MKNAMRIRETNIRVAALRIPVRELERSTAFYCERLGLAQGRLDARQRTRTLLPALPHGPVLELAEADVVPPLHFPVKGGHFQPIIRVHASDLDGMFHRLTGTAVTAIHQDLPDDGCGRFFEAADPDGTWLQYHVNIGEPAIMAGTTEAVVNVEIPVSDVRRSAAYYARIGFALEREPNDDVAFLCAGRLVDRFGYADIAEFGIILTRRDDFPLMRFRRGEAWEPIMVLQAPDIASYRSQLLAGGVTVGEWQRGIADGDLLLRDPDGHMLGMSACAADAYVVSSTIATK